MANEEKQDGSLTETLEEKVNDLKAGAKKEAGVLDTLKGGVESVKGAFSTVTGGVGKAWSTFGEWKEEGVCVMHLCRRLYVFFHTGDGPSTVFPACKMYHRTHTLRLLAGGRIQQSAAARRVSGSGPLAD